MADIDLDKVLELSDEELEKISSTTGSAPKDLETETATEEPKKTEEKVEPESTEEKKTEETPKSDETTAPKLVDPADKSKGPDVFAEQKKQQEGAAAAAKKAEDDKKPTVVDEKKPEEKQAEGEQKKTDEQPKQPVDDTAAQTAAMHKAFYERIMAPFKADGKTIQLQSVEDVVRLMQMGANYTRKMQALGPQRKLMLMLENNGLLSEDKLNFLIDLDKKNPEAIRKLLADAKMDPMEFDASKPVNYRGGAHFVSDGEANLNDAIQDLQVRDGGRETLQIINTTWDLASKKILGDNPELLDTIHTQRSNGIYAKIVNEVDRRKTLGMIPASAPFLQAYKLVGDELAARGAFQSAAQPAAGQTPAGNGTPVAVRPAKTPTPASSVDPRVKAAAPTRTTPKTAQVSTNYLAMSDEEFLKLSSPGGG